MASGREAWPRLRMRTVTDTETGNGPFDVTTGGTDYGDSIVRVATTNGLTIPDYFTPSTQLADDDNDWDLGSSGPGVIPGTPLGVAGGKDGMLYVFRTSSLGGYNSGNTGLAQPCRGKRPTPIQAVKRVVSGAVTTFTTIPRCTVLASATFLRHFHSPDRSSPRHRRCRLNRARSR